MEMLINKATIKKLRMEKSWSQEKLAVILMLWGLAQMSVPIYEFSAHQSAVISLMFMFFAAFVLLAFFTSIATKRFYILGGCILLGTLVAPPDLLASVKMALPLIVLFELSVLLAKRFGGTEDSFQDAV